MDGNSGRRCLIVSGGEYGGLHNIEPGAFIIACDRGYEYARRAGLRPDAVIGDFDSFEDGEALARADGLSVIRVPYRKDDTDTMLAVRYALERGYDNIMLTCALGGRLDHLLANLQTAAFIVRHGGRARIVSDDTEVTVFTAGGVTLPRRDGWSLSVFSLTDRCEGVSIRGAGYDVTDAVLENTFPLGVSNAWKEAQTDITVREGILAVVSARYHTGETVHDEQPDGKGETI